MHHDDLNLDEFFTYPPYSLNKTAKSKLILPYLNKLCAYHQEHSQEFAALSQLESDLYNKHNTYTSIEDLPFTHVQLFKYLDLKSIKDEDIFKKMTSSGTSSNAVSKIYLDRQTALNQSRTLTHIMNEFLGSKRRKMLIIDSQAVLKDPKLFSARGAGIMGLMPFGRDHCFALDNEYKLNIDLVINFFQENAHELILIFGFTFMVWLNLYQQLSKHQLNFKLDNAVLIHAGGWKKMQNIAVDNDIFKQSLRSVLGEKLAIHNFYGMVEQTGSVYVECEHGNLHASNFSDIIIRDSITHQVLDKNQIGVIQSISMLPHSYPGFSLLTEDLGQILGEDDCPCGRCGKYFKVEGRIPKAEVRGCSDVYN